MKIQITIVKDGVTKTETFTGYDNAMSNVYTKSLDYMDEQRKRVMPEEIESPIHQGVGSVV